MIFPAKHISGRDAVTEQKPYSPVSLHYMPHISTFQVVYDVIFLVIMASTLCKVLWDSGYGWQYFRCFLCLIQSAHSASSISTLHHSPHLPLFVFGAAMQGHLVRTAMFVPHITPVPTICPAAPDEFLLLYFTTSGGMFFIAFSRLKALLPGFLNF